ncbi:MAG TPA: glucose-6-phosphate dehydrogenase assembly protein OpcA [Candidatus Binatus sp.]|nr:glucose-6-phosphate dehydrogenase assembly protein OpcA [Candidatus Binatus sp.]
MSALDDGAATPVWTAGFAPVKVEEAEATLTARWREIVASSSGTPTARALTLNLVTFVDRPTASGEVSKVLNEIAETHSVRAVTIIEDATVQEDAPQAFMRPDSVDAFSEEVFVRVNPRAAQSAASVVLALLAADLPVYLWWRADSPFGRPLFRQLAPLVKKIVVDSMRFGDTTAALDTLRRLTEHRAGHVAVADLNWKRIKPWRREIAACFDDPTVLELLREFDKCRIEFAVDPGHADAQHKTARAALIAGWLANCMPRLRGRVRLEPVPADGVRAGRIFAVLFQSTKSRATLSLMRQEEPRGIAAETRDARGQVVRTRFFPESTQSEAQLLHRSIDDPARDPMFEAALAEE